MLHSIKQCLCGIILVSKKSVDYLNQDNIIHTYYMYLYDLNLERVFETHKIYTLRGNHKYEWMCDIRLDLFDMYRLEYGSCYDMKIYKTLDHEINMDEILSIKESSTAKIIYNDKAIFKYENINLLTLLLKYILFLLPLELQNEIKIILFNLSYKTLIL